MNKMKRKGFTLIELVVVIAIMAILALIAVPNLMAYIDRAKTAKIDANMKNVHTAAEMVRQTERELDTEKVKRYSNIENIEENENPVELTYTVFENEDKQVIVQYKDNKGKIHTFPKEFGNLSGGDNGEEPVVDPSYGNEYLATDEDFTWTNNNSGYTATNETSKGYYKYTGEAEIVKIPHVIKGHPMTSYYMMFESTSVTKIISDNSNVTDMRSMFRNSQATTLDLSSFDTSNVEDMSYMFNNSQATTITGLNKFDTSNVTTMSWMFRDSKVTTLDLSSFNTSNVTNMSYMFMASQATTLDLSNFDTSKVTDMRSIFYNSKATTLDLSSFDTSNVTNMSFMFRNSQATTGYARTSEDADRLNASSYKPSGLTFVVTDNEYLADDSDFEWVKDINGGYTATNETGTGYYKYTGDKTTVKIPHEIKGHPMTRYDRMFKSTSVTKIISDNSNVTDISRMFYHSQATSLDLSNFDTSKVTSMSYMFQGSQATTIIGLNNFNTSNVTDMSWMFNNSHATTLDLSSFNTSKVTNMRYMFYYSKATTLDLSSFNTSKVTDMSFMFWDSQATTITGLNKFDTSKVTDMRNMFSNTKATTLDLSSFDTSNVTNTTYMFYGSQATTGYARTQEDANRFNASSYKPSGLTFVVKS